MEDKPQEIQENNQKEVTSTEPAVREVIKDLPETNVKPNSCFKLSTFIGDNSEVKIANWIRIYESLANRSKWTDEDKKWNLVSYLEKEALDFYIEHVLTKNLEWSEAKNLFVQRFEQLGIEPYMQFLSHKWSPKAETIKDYFKKMRALGFSSNLEEKDILVGLSRNLPKHLREEFQCVTSLQQWISVAFLLQLRFENRNNQPSFNKHQPWRNRKGSRNRQNDKSRSNQSGQHQSNQSTSHQAAPSSERESNINQIESLAPYLLNLPAEHPLSVKETITVEADSNTAAAIPQKSA